MRICFSLYGSQRIDTWTLWTVICTVETGNLLFSFLQKHFKIVSHFPFGCYVYTSCYLCTETCMLSQQIKVVPKKSFPDKNEFLPPVVVGCLDRFRKQISILAATYFNVPCLKRIAL